MELTEPLALDLLVSQQCQRAQQKLMKILPQRRVMEKLFHKIVKVGLRNLKMQSLRTPKRQRWMELISNVPPVVVNKWYLLLK